MPVFKIEIEYKGKDEFAVRAGSREEAEELAGEMFYSKHETAEIYTITGEKIGDRY